LFTKNGRALTAKGVKPICLFQQVFKSTYLFGAFSPINGRSFLLELPFCNNDTFQIYLNEFSEQEPNEFKIIVLDNGAFHKSKALKIPENICLIFLPPYSPELNPAERIWEIVKANFTGLLFKDLELLSDFIKNQVNQLTAKIVISACSYPYIFESLDWTI
jgi:transposase